MLPSRLSQGRLADHARDYPVMAIKQINEAAPAADTASAGFPSGDTLLGLLRLAPVAYFGGQPRVGCDGSGVERIEFKMRGFGLIVKRLVFPAGEMHNE